MKLRDFAAEIYARPGVEAACLRLQDTDGQSVPLLLWRLWTVHEGRDVDVEFLDRAVEVARTWEHCAVVPLREVRRRLKAPLQPVGDAVREALLGDVAAAELAAERILLDALEALTPGPGGVRIEVLPALRAAGARWGGTPSDQGLARLIQAVSLKAPLARSHRSATN